MTACEYPQRERLNHLINRFEGAVRCGNDALADEMRVTMLAHLHESYAEEVGRVSELLTAFDPSDRFASVSAHLADLLRRLSLGAGQ